MASALIDNWMQEEGNASFDAGGAVAAQGRVDEGVLAAMLDNDWFNLPPPPSLDREAFTIEPVRGLSLADGAATLTASTVHAIALGLRHFPMRSRPPFPPRGGCPQGPLLHTIPDRPGLRFPPITHQIGQPAVRINRT